MGKLFSGDVGTIISINMQRDITTATSYSLFVQNPDGTTTSWTPTITNTNFFEYTTVSGDFDQSGEYEIQPRLTLGGWTGSGDPIKFYVFKKTS